VNSEPFFSEVANWQQLESIKRHSHTSTPEKRKLLKKEERLKEA